MSSLFWLFLGPELLPLVIVGVALALIVGAVTRARAFNILGAALLVVVLMPFIDVVLDALPLGILLILGLIAVISVFRALAGALLGSRAADHTVGILAADAIRIALAVCFVVCLLPFRLALGGLRLLAWRRW